MARCLTTDELLALATDSATGRQADRLSRHCERCAACRQLLEEWRNNQLYAGDIRQAVREGSSVASSEIAIAQGFTNARSVMPLMSADGINGYEILGEIHRGGQGVVYRAIQKSTGRQVAIKVAFEEAQAAGKRPHRFDREVELASRLKHPSIIAIFDSGTTADGRCYFVMDYVQGLPIDQYVRERELGLRQALELFITICEAVNHAHQRGVIHRDLKPSNILVDVEGVPRVLDFGLAKALGVLGRFSSVVSAAGQLLGTVPYMAPEQLSGRPQSADIRTDVYALGVLLYEILAGCLPYDIGLAASDMLRRITEGAPIPPSRAWNSIRGIDGQGSAKNRRAAHPVGDELDAITLKAMSLSPDRRYQNAADLARDVRRYLSGEPIEAKRDRGLYVFRKILYRYRLLASIVGSFLVLVSVALTLITSLYFTVEEERQLAQRERDRAVSAQHKADSRAEQLRSVMYLGRMSSAVMAANAANFQKLREDLYVCPADLRGWEWYSLVSLFDHSRRTPPGHEGRVLALSTAVGGDRVASGSQDGTVRFWDIENLKEVSPPVSFGKCQDICFSEDGQKFATLEPAGEVRIHSLSRSDVLPLPRSGAVRCMGFSVDGALFAVGDASGWIEIWNAASGTLVRQVGPHQACSYMLAFSPDSKLLATAGWDQTIRIWNVETGLRLLTLSDQHECVSTVAWSPDGLQLASGGCTGSVLLRDLWSGKAARVLQTRSDHVSTLAFSPDGRLLVSADMSRNLCFWDTQSGRAWCKFLTDGAWLRCLSFSRDGKSLLGAGNDYGIRRWNLDHVPYTTSMKAHTRPAHVVAFDAQGRVVSGGDEGLVKLWDLPSGRLVRTFTGHENKVRTLACSPDGTWIVSGSQDHTLRMWDVETGKTLHVLPGHEDGVLSVAISPDGRLIASGGSDRVAKNKDTSVHIWDSATGKEMRRFYGHKAGIPALTFSPDGSMLASGGRDRMVIIWDVATGQPITTFKRHTGSIRSLAFSPDGRSVFSGSEDNTVQTWDPQTGRLLNAPLVHPRAPLAIAVSPDGSRRATCGDWGYINIWPNGDINWELRTLRTAHQSVWSLAFSRDGSCLAYCDESGEIWVRRTISRDDLRGSAQAAEGLAAGATRLWGLRQRNDAESVFKEALDMHHSIFPTNDTRTKLLEARFASFQRGEFAESQPPQLMIPAATQPVSPVGILDAGELPEERFQTATSKPAPRRAETDQP